MHWSLEDLKMYILPFSNSWEKKRSILFPKFWHPRSYSSFGSYAQTWTNLAKGMYISLTVYSALWFRGTVNSFLYHYQFKMEKWFLYKKNQFTNSRLRVNRCLARATTITEGRMCILFVASLFPSELCFWSDGWHFAFGSPCFLVLQFYSLFGPVLSLFSNSNGEPYCWIYLGPRKKPPEEEIWLSKQPPLRLWLEG